MGMNPMNRLYLMIFICFSFVRSQKTEGESKKKVLIINVGNNQKINGVSIMYQKIKKYLEEKVEVDILDTTNCDYPINFFLFTNTDNPDLLHFSKKSTYLKHYKKKMYDAVHIAEMICPQSIASSRAFYSSGIPFTMMHHTNYSYYIQRYIFSIPDCIVKYIQHLGSKYASGIMYYGEGIVREFAHNPKDPRNRIMPNGFDEEMFNTNQDEDCFKTKNYLENELGLKRPYLVCVSRIAVEKNLEDFFKLDAEGSKIMVGDGHLLQAYKDKYPNITFVGSKKGTELASYYKNADVFVFPSRSETFGGVMIESMGCGTPVAAYPQILGKSCLYSG